MANTFELKAEYEFRLAQLNRRKQDDQTAAEEMQSIISAVIDSEGEKRKELQQRYAEIKATRTALAGEIEELQRLVYEACIGFHRVEEEAAQLAYDQALRKSKDARKAMDDAIEQRLRFQNSKGPRKHTEESALELARIEGLVAERKVMSGVAAREKEVAFSKLQSAQNRTRTAVYAVETGQLNLVPLAHHLTPESDSLTI